MALQMLMVYSTPALMDGQARTPPMGWRSWEAYYELVDEAKMMDTMDVLTDRSRFVDWWGRPCKKGTEGCNAMSLAELGFSDVGLDAGFEDCTSRTVGGKPAFHDANGRPLIDRGKFPSGLGALVKHGHSRNLSVSWYGNACACKKENSYTAHTQPTIAQAIAGTVAATVEYGFDGLKLDSCSMFNNMTLWSKLINASGGRVLIENCHQGGIVPGQRIPGQDCDGARGDCPYHVFRTSDDVFNHWVHVVNNINSVTPYLSQADASVVPRSRPGQWAYPDMLEVGNLGCPTGASCNQTTAPLEDRSQFGMWAIVSSPLVLSVDLTNQAMLERVWPILSNREAIRVNQHWSGSPGRLLVTDRTTYPSPLSPQGYYTFPGGLGQSRGWQNVPGMTGPTPWQVGPCVDEWTGGPCTRHYMTLGGGAMNMSLDAAADWCNRNASCQGYTVVTQVDGNLTDLSRARAVYFRDETQIFFMDKQVADLPKPIGTSQYTSYVKASRAPPLSPTTSGVQIWVKDCSGMDGKQAALALLLVNVGQGTLGTYSLPLSKLPPKFRSHAPLRIRDVWNHRPVDETVLSADNPLVFNNVAPHDSVFYLLSPL
jgi:hypothetical protein